MENWEERSEESIFSRCLVEREEGKKKWWDLSVFSLGPPKYFLLKFEKMLKGKPVKEWERQKCPCEWVCIF